MTRPESNYGLISLLNNLKEAFFCLSSVEINYCMIFMAVFSSLLFDKAMPDDFKSNIIIKKGIGLCQRKLTQIYYKKNKINFHFWQPLRSHLAIWSKQPCQNSAKLHRPLRPSTTCPTPQDSKTWRARWQRPTLTRGKSHVWNHLVVWPQQPPLKSYPNCFPVDPAQAWRTFCATHKAILTKRWKHARGRQPQPRQKKCERLLAAIRTICHNKTFWSILKLLVGHLKNILAKAKLNGWILLKDLEPRIYPFLRPIRLWLKEDNFHISFTAKVTSFYTTKRDLSLKNSSLNVDFLHNRTFQ